LYAALHRLRRRMQRAVLSDRFDEVRRLTPAVDRVYAEIGRNNRRRNCANSGRNALAGPLRTA
jgi:hypothetical protein